MILHRIQEAAARHPGRAAIQMKHEGGYRKYTYHDVIKAVASAAQSFAGKGIRKGDRVAILSENRPEWMFAYLSLAALGSVVVPLDAQLTDKEVSLLLASSEAKAVCVSSTTRQKLPRGGSFTVFSFDMEDGASFSGMLKAYPDAPLPSAPAAGDLAAILYTSGTTGDPKGVMLTHGNLESNCSSIIKLDILIPTDNMLCILPLHHTYAAMVCMILPLSLGATVTILNSLKGPDILACMQETGVSVLVGVPQLFTGFRRAIFEGIQKKSAAARFIVKLLLALNSILRKALNKNIGRAIFKQVHARFGPRFRLSASGGARLEPDVYRDLSNLGFLLIEGYGLTETSPVSTFNPLTKQKAGSIGIPIPGVEVRIANPDENGMGELAVRGPNVMLGYYKKPKETAEVIRDGWFYTGDLGYRDRDGYFFITGRSKEMIALSTGKKIFPDELEVYYKQIPSIKEFCLLQTERGLEAAVVPDFDYLRKTNMSNSRETIADEIEGLAKHLPPYKRIMGLKVFKDPLPVTRLGKLKRSLVREMYLKGAGPAEKAAPDEDADLLGSTVGKKVLACLEPFSAKKKILSGDNLELDLGFDSLARVEFVVNLEKAFGITLPDSFGAEVFTVKDIVLNILEQLAQGAAKTGGRARLSWADILAQEPSEEVKKSFMLDAGPLRNMGKYAIKLLFKAFYLIYGRMTVKGVENLPARGPYLIAPNHASFTDAPLVMAAIPWSTGSQTFFLGHTKYFGSAVTSRIAKLIQVIPVDMDARLYSALQVSAYVLRRGKILMVFPEGTRSHDGSLKEFKKGVGIIARELNVPIVPVAIRGTHDMMAVGSVFPKPAKVGVSIGKPLYPGDLDYDGIVKKLREEVEKLLEERKGFKKKDV